MADGRKCSIQEVNEFVGADTGESDTHISAERRTLIEGSNVVEGILPTSQEGNFQDAEVRAVCGDNLT